ncbi:MAG: T9SS type A sorting domain-containing protein, partial [Parcubacteria group bacterium]
VRQKNDSKVLGVFNCSPQTETFTLIGNAYTGSYRDILSDSSKMLTPDIHMTLPAWGFTVLESQGASVVNGSETMTPYQFSLQQNYPNPYNPSTTIEYTIPRQSHVTVKIFDLLGREVAVLVNEKKEAGWYSVRWDASAKSSGIYFYTLQAGEYRYTKRMALLK